MPNAYFYTDEPKPRDFSARQLRKRMEAVGQGQRRRHRGRRAAMLLAAVAVPAFAAPGQWERLAIGNAGASALELEPMPFERPSDSFPGAAFYYLADDTPQPRLDAGVHSDAENAPTSFTPSETFTGPIGPVARAMRVDNSGVDRTRAQACLTAAIYYEAASEPDQGQRGVAQVILNRVAHPSFPKTVCGVVYQGSERRTGCQFTFTCDGALARIPNRMFWERAANVARMALAGYVEPSVGLATHYHTIAVHPYWDAKMINLATIGAHRFFRLPGSAGSTGAFRYAYRGSEPLPQAHARTYVANSITDVSSDPLALQRAYETGLKQAQASVVTPTPTGFATTHAEAAPIYTAEQQKRGGDRLYHSDTLPEATIRPEYRNSGQWISQPN